MVIWIIGMSASGKTTLGLELYNLLKATGEKWAFLDGDILRNVFGNSGHTIEDRRVNAYRISNLCRVLDIQGINVIACVLSIFHDNQDYNRSHFTGYKEVFLHVDCQKLLKRDNKNLYQKALDGELKNVVGVDIPFAQPKSPDLIINNDLDFPDFNKMAHDVLKKLGVPLNIPYKYSSIDHHKYPQKYQFTEYLGESFLDEYERTRNSFLGLLLGRIGNSAAYVGKPWLAAEHALEILIQENEKNRPSGNSGTIDTNSTLLQLFENVFKGHAAEAQRDLLFKFVKKFEVSKKIYSSYEALTWKSSSRDFSDISNYLLFALSAAIYCQKYAGNYERMQLFNSLLKVNDLVIASENKPETVDVILLQFACISMEMEIYIKIRELAYA